MKIYAIKVALRGVSPMIWRRLRIGGNTSLASLHYIIQITQGWSDDHLHLFHIYGKDYGVYKPGGMGFSDNAYQVVIDDFGFEVGDRFTYEYNFNENWLHDIRVEAFEEFSSRKKIPFCLSGNGMPGATEFDYYDKLVDVLAIIVDENDTTTTVGEVRRRIEELDTLHLNRKKVNQALVHLDLEDPTIEQQCVVIG